MDELIQKVQEKTGVDADRAKDVINTVINFLKDKLPAPIAGQLDKFVGGGDEAGAEGESMMDQAKDGLGGLMGR